MSEHGHIKFWQEIGRRNVLRVAAVYVGFSWAVVHSGVVVGEALELPHWIMRFVSAVLIVGFPAVVAFAWVYEITPDGLKRAEEVERDKSITHRTAHRLNIVIIALIVLLAGLYGADRFLLSHEGAEGAAHVAAEGAAKAPTGEDVSIAVLPFLNLSSDKEQEFFSDGMTEEITSALAEVKSLKVVGRTSAFQFKGENKDLRAIGQSLGATNLLEGSVRKAGDRVRITGQLIRAADGTHIWTASYDRDLKDVFAVQEEVAKAIAAALQVPLGLSEGQRLVSNRTADTDSYQDYLRAIPLIRRRGGAYTLAPAIELLERSVARDPNFAPTWGVLAEAYALSPQYGDVTLTQRPIEEGRRSVDSDFQKAETAARRALALDPRSVEGHVALATTLENRGRLAEAEDLFNQALKLDANNPDLLHHYGLFLGSVGRLKEALAVRTQLQALEPFVPVFNAVLGAVLQATGQNDAAFAVYNAMPAGGFREGAMARYYASLGRYAEAADTLERAPYMNPSVKEAAARVLRRAPQPIADRDLPDLGQQDFVYITVGLPERALGYLARAIDVGFPSPPEFISVFQPIAAPARKTARFKELMRKSGRVDYWRARGWADVCHPVGSDDFECP